MIILGIDPGYAIVGYGIIRYEKNKFTVLDFGAITTPAKVDFSDRIMSIYADLEYLFQKYKPDAMAIEKLFFNTNKKNHIAVALFMKKH